MAKAKTEHVVFRNQELFCSNCGRSQAIPFPMEIPVFSAMTTAFTKSHSKCEKIWQEPTVDQGKPEILKAHWWMANGERGISSEAMWHAIMGIPNHSKWGNCPPSDPDDFRRCYLLLQTIPEWKEKLDLLRPLSKTWSNLVDNWDKLTEMLEEQLKTRKVNGMYDLMKQLRVK